ncbi:hypothetical protein BV898_02099 [Hypsibius exemplaris]|uniref:Uncharacterized protein n=1 Tax=Hypsibius exemplaris TaxID=2072580 RepID=A0A1W0X9D6_HYPEX|nr:hypothetical protein BV898_02099 [Hypsibius exemplaris]
MLGTNFLGNFLLGFNAFTSYVIVGIVVLAVLGKIIWRRFAADRSSAVQVVAANEENIEAEQPQETPQQRKAYMKQLRMAVILLASFIFCALCNLPRSVASSYFSQYTSHMPVLLLWLRLIVGIQFAFLPTPCSIMIGPGSGL